MKHTLTVIGPLGERRAYLDLSEEEARRRYLRYADLEGALITSFDFDDEFVVYDAYSLDRPRPDR